MRRLLPILISMLLHGYVGLRLTPPLGGWPAAGSALSVLLAASALLLPLSLIGRNLRWPSARTTLAWSGMLALGWFSSLFVLTVLRDALLLTSSALVALWPGALELDGIRQATAGAVLAAAATVTVVGVWNAPRTAAVVRVDVPVPGLPEGPARVHHRADQRHPRRADHPRRKEPAPGAAAAVVGSGAAGRPTGGRQCGPGPQPNCNSLFSFQFDWLAGTEQLLPASGGAPKLGARVRAA